jgi:putative hydrolase of the HAD superfamily
VFFDLDDTIYPSSTGLWLAIRARMNAFIRDRLNIAEDEIPALREQYFLQYGTTLRGLEARHGVDAQDFLHYVHDLPLREYLKPDPLQRAVIQSLRTRKLVFTNADAGHAARVLAALHLDDCFELIVDVNSVAPYCKPMPESFRIAMQLADEPDPSRCVLIDDLPSTTRAARSEGFHTILYGAAEPRSDADAAFVKWKDLPTVLRSVDAGS